MSPLGSAPVDMGPALPAVDRARERHLHYCTSCGPVGSCGHWERIKARLLAAQEGAGR